MKKLLFIAMCGIAIYTVSCSNEKKSSNQILDIIEDIQDNSNFDKLDNCKELDEECEYVIKTQKAIDDTRLKLIKIEDRLSQNVQINNEEEFTKCLYWILGMNKSLDESMNYFKAHFAYLEKFVNKKKEDHTNKYEEIKSNLLSKNKNTIEAAKPVVEKQTQFNESNIKFQDVLRQMLKEVENKNWGAAAALLNSEDAIAYRVNAAELMTAYYKFERARAESILGSCETYKNIYN